MSLPQSITGTNAMLRGSHFVNDLYLCGRSVLEKLAGSWTAGRCNGQGLLKGRRAGVSSCLLGLLGLGRHDCGRHLEATGRGSDCLPGGPPTTQGGRCAGGSDAHHLKSVDL